VAIEASPAAKAITRQEDDSGDQGNRNQDRAELQKARAEIGALRAQLRAAERRLADMERANRRAEVRSPKADRPLAPRAAQREPGLSYKALPPAPANRAMAKSYSRADDEAFTRAGEKLRAAGQELNDARDRARQTVERRLDQMERQLTNMVDQLSQMKRQLSSDDGSSPTHK
jgi:DNA repair exonuclease SbcCD ATPase subunit